MGEDEVKRLEMILDQYYICDNAILLRVSLIFLFGIIFCFIGVMDGQKRKYVANQLLTVLLVILTVCFTGYILFFLGLQPEVEYKYFNSILFFIPGAILIITGFVRGVIYKKWRLIGLRFIRYISYIIIFELLWLSLICSLDVLKFSAGTLAVLLVETILLICEKKETVRKEYKKESDHPNTELFPTRQRQLENFIPVLKKQNDEPYAIMITGGWGTGKTSFVKALEQKLENDEFIWVYSGSEKSAADIMQEISAQIITILKENNIYVGKENIIEKYFMSFSEIAEIKGSHYLSQILTGVMNKCIDGQDYINSLLLDLNKTIYLIIDDLDRCDEEYQKKMFKVIRESIAFYNCKTLFLVDKEQFVVNQDADYIEKYVSYEVNLCKVDYDEIVTNLFDCIYDDKFINDLSDELLKGRNAEEIKTEIYHIPKEILEEYKKEFAKCENSGDIKNENGQAEKAEKLREIIEAIEKNISNPRKVKKYFKGIRHNLLNISGGIGKCSEEYKKEDWVRCAITVQFVKCFLPKIFFNIQMEGSLYKFKQKDTADVINLIWETDKSAIISGEDKLEYIYNQIIFFADAADYNKIQMQKERYLNELRNGKGISGNLSKYVQWAENYEDINKILSIYERGFSSIENPNEIMDEIVDKLSIGYSVFRTDCREFVQISNRLIQQLSRLHLTKREEQSFNLKGQSIADRVISENKQLFLNVVILVYPLNKTVDQMIGSGTWDINKLYKVLKQIDDNTFYEGWESNQDKLQELKDWFLKIQNVLESNRYDEVEEDIEDISCKIDTIFEAYELWSNIKHVIDKSKQGKKQEIEKYFWLDGYWQCRNEIFESENIDLLKQALQTLRIFYSTEGRHYLQGEIQLLHSVVEMSVLKWEKDPQWFGKEKESIDILFRALVDELERHVSQTVEYNMILQRIRILVFKFNDE